MKRMLLIGALLLTGCDASLSGILDTLTSAQATFDKADTDHDGNLTYQETATALSISDTAAQAADANKDGKIGSLEFIALAGRKSIPSQTASPNPS